MERELDPNYFRVIPRDFFNESKLLCCLGKLSVAIHDGMTNGLNLRQQFENEPFVVAQDQADGSLTVLNYQVFLNDRPLYLYTTYNSRDKYPLKADYEDETYQVLDEQGNLATNFGVENNE